MNFLIAVMGFAGSIAVALVQFPGGYLADKQGRRGLIVTMTFGLAIGSLFFIFAPSWQFILIGLLVQNVCSIYGPALMAMVIDSLPPENRGAGFSFQSVITTIIILPAPLIAQYLVAAFKFDLGMRIAYTMVAAAYFSISILRLKTQRNVATDFAENKIQYPKRIPRIRYIGKRRNLCLAKGSQISL